MTPYKLQILLTMALVLNVIGGKVSFFAAAREVKRENDGGEDEGDGEKIALNAFTGFSPPPPIARYRAMRKKRPHALPSPIACGSRVASHNYPKWGACSRATCYGELLREKTKQGIQFSMNLGRVFVFCNSPPPR